MQALIEAEMQQMEFDSLVEDEGQYPLMERSKSQEFHSRNGGIAVNYKVDSVQTDSGEERMVLREN